MASRVVVCLVLLVLLPAGKTSLLKSHHLSHFMFYETLHYSQDELHNNHLRVQRSTNDAEKEIVIKFSAYQKSFVLVLTPNEDSMAHKVRVRLVGEKGRVRTLHPDQLVKEMYHGYVENCTGSYVHGYIHDGIFDGIIHMGVDTYHIEGAWKFFDGSTPAQFHSIIYHEEDVKHHPDGKNSSYCGHQALLRKMQETAVPLNKPRQIRATHQREKRVTQSGNTVCQLNLAADYHYYTNVGGRSEAVTRNELSTILTEVNRIYSTTDFNFDRVADGISFYVADITIFTREDQPSSAFAQGNIAVNSFLDLWSQENHDAFCLAMLMTYRDFSGGVLGLAWVAEPPGGNIGGVCTPRARLSSGERSLNTAIVTQLNFGLRQSRSVVIVTVSHELGHNFGSPHDPQNDVCSPGSSGGGNFIMYFSATDGSQTNNKRFSVCSINSIRAVLESSRSGCFIPGANVCGNGIVESGNNEECDCGDHGNDRAACDMVDACCGFDCKLRSGVGSQCTPRGPSGANPCCSDQCQFLNSLSVCQEDVDCINQVNCTGRSAMCNVTSKDYKPDRTTLCNGGSNTCQSGDCTGSVCTILADSNGKVSECQCTGNKDELCDVCCTNNAGECVSSFKLAGINGTHRAAGRACDDFTGYCAQPVQGAPPQCVKINNDDFLDILKNLFTEETLLEFVQWLQTYWYIPAGIIVIVTIVIILLPLTYRKKSRKKLRQGLNTIRRRVSRHGRHVNNTQQVHTGGVGVNRRNSIPRGNAYRPKKLSERDGIQRIRYFFPHADEDTVRNVMRQKGNEAASVQQLLEMGYPLKRQTVDVLPIHP